MSNQPHNSDNLDQQLAYLILAGAGLFTASRLWVHVKPWVMGRLHQVQTNLGRGLVLDTAAGLRISTADVVGVLVIAIPLLLVLVLLKHRFSRRHDRGGSGS